MNTFINIQNLTFAYETNINPLFDAVTLQLHSGWTGIVGANGSGKTTLLKLLSGNLKPEYGVVNIPGIAHYNEQRTDAMPPEFPDFLAGKSKNLFRIKEALNECSCAQILVSHDHAFWENIVDQYWRFDQDSGEHFSVRRH